MGDKRRAGRLLRRFTPRSEMGVMGRQFCVYILTNRRNTVLYTGVTRDLKRRVWQHREKLVPGFTQRYNAYKLVFYEVTDDAHAAIAREKQIKAGSRQKKINLIEAMNPEWRDLYEYL
jgi:putative endonuclease